MLKRKCELYIDVPWGKLALVTWGNPDYSPVLLLHGYMDSAATFIPLVELLPETYYYVAVDLPGNGKSDPFPPGPLLSHIHMVEPIRRVVDHMRWDKFVCLLHSAGFLYAIFYNAIFPGKLTKLISLDPGYCLTMNYLTTYNVEACMWRFHNKYYENYKSFYEDPPKLSYKAAVKMMALARKLTEKQAEIIISRSIVPSNDGNYILTWDPRLKTLPGVIIPEETQWQIIRTHTPLMLNIHASKKIYAGKTFEYFITKTLEKIHALPECSTVTVNGGHDVHITNPEVVLPHIVEFLNRDVNIVKSKL